VGFVPVQAAGPGGAGRDGDGYFVGGGEVVGYCVRGGAMDDYGGRHFGKLLSGRQVLVWRGLFLRKGVWVGEGGLKGGRKLVVLKEVVVKKGGRKG